MWSNLIKKISMKISLVMQLFVCVVLRRPALPSKSVVDISPNQEQFKQGIDEIVAGFRSTIGK